MTASSGETRKEILILITELPEGEYLDKASWARLSPADQAQALTIPALADRRRFVAGRVLLSRAIEKLCGVALRPEIRQEPLEAPLVQNAPRPLHFSISHSHRGVVVAASLHGRIGVDLEWLQPVEITSLRHVFSTEEWEAIIRKNPEESARTALSMFSAKEASAKFLQCKEALDPMSLPSASCALCELTTWTLELAAEPYVLCLAHKTAEAEIQIKKESAYPP